MFYFYLSFLISHTVCLHSNKTLTDMDLAVELLTEVQNQTYENEEGCIAYDLHLSEENPTTIYIYECYENSAALKLHNSASYYKDIVVKKLVPIIKTEKILTLHPINDMGIEME